MVVQYLYGWCYERSEGQSWGLSVAWGEGSLVRVVECFVGVEEEVARVIVSLDILMLGRLFSVRILRKRVANSGLLSPARTLAISAHACTLHVAVIRSSGGMFVGGCMVAFLFVPVAAPA